jgi:dephospho-CoA kinase
MHVIALTGSVAAGKSSAGALLRRWGATMIDADALVRALQQPGQPVFRAIVAAFGTSVLAPDGTLDRAVMRQQILDEPDARRRLEAIVHPAVDRARRLLIDSARARGDAIVIADIPLLFEAADPAEYDGVIVVDAPLTERRRRLIEDRHFSARDADRLIAVQMPAAEKRARATWIIDNDADRATLERRTRAVWDALPR